MTWAGLAIAVGVTFVGLVAAGLVLQLFCRILYRIASGSW